MCAAESGTTGQCATCLCKRTATTQNFLTQSPSVCNRIICRVEHLGTWLDLVIVAGDLNFTLLGVQALRTVRSRKYTAHKHWSLLHIAAGHGVNT